MYLNKQKSPYVIVLVIILCLMVIVPVSYAQDENRCERVIIYINNGQTIIEEVTGENSFVACFFAEKGEEITITVSTVFGNLQPVLAVFDKTAKLLSSLDEEISPLELKFIAPSTDYYILIVDRFGSENGTTSGIFELTLQKNQNSNPPANADLQPLTVINHSIFGICQFSYGAVSASNVSVSFTSTKMQFISPGAAKSYLLPAARYNTQLVVCKGPSSNGGIILTDPEFENIELDAPKEITVFNPDIAPQFGTEDWLESAWDGEVAWLPERKPDFIAALNIFQQLALDFDRDDISQQIVSSLGTSYISYIFTEDPAYSTSDTDIVNAIDYLEQALEAVPDGKIDFNNDFVKTAANAALYYRLLLGNFARLMTPNEKALDVMLQMADAGLVGDVDEQTVSTRIDIGFVYQTNGDFDNAEQYYMDAQTLAKKNKQSQFESQILNYLGQIEAARQNYEGAVAFFDAAANAVVGGDTGLQGAYLYNAGSMLLDLGRTSDAIERFNQAIELDPDVPNNAYLYRGMGRYSDGDFDKALEDFDFIINRNPDEAYGYFWRGRVNFELGNFESARDDLIKAASYQGMSEKVFMYLGDAYDQLNESAFALRSYQRYIELSPAPEARVLDRVAELQKP